MYLVEAIRNRQKEFIALCKNHDVKTLYAFGSSTNDRFNENSSDIDLLIELECVDPLKRGEYLLALWDLFEAFFQRKVDLLTSSQIKNPILKRNIENTKVLIYDGKGLKVSQ